MRTFVTACALCLAIPATAGIEHTILHGVEVGSVYVWIGPEGPQAPPDLSDLAEPVRRKMQELFQSTLPAQLRAGLQEQLESSVESRLREAGIAITPDAPASFHVRVEVVAVPDACFATIESALVEDALLVRNGLRVPAQSWQSGGSPSSNTIGGCVQSIEEVVGMTVDDFVETYGAMNPAS